MVVGLLAGRPKAPDPWHEAENAPFERADLDIAILLVEHGMDFAMGRADRLVVMNVGAKLDERAPDRVRAEPAIVDACLGTVA